MTIVDSNNNKFREIMNDTITESINDGIDLSIIVIKNSKQKIMNTMCPLPTDAYYMGVIDALDAMTDLLEKSKRKEHKREIS